MPAQLLPGIGRFFLLDTKRTRTYHVFMESTEKKETFGAWCVSDAEENSAVAETADIVVGRVCALKKGERMLIVTNPHRDTSLISQALYDAAVRAGGQPALIFQETKSSLDFADEAVIAALKTEPHVFASVSSNKLGKDASSIASPLTAPNGTKYDHIFEYNLYGKKIMRAIWSPGITLDMFVRTAGIDYALLKKRCARMCARFENAVSVRVTAPSGTDITVPVAGRRPFADDGDFTCPSSGGNIPAGEVFISPSVGKAEGVIVFDGSMSLTSGDILIYTPITVRVEKGYVSSITGGQEAQMLLETVTAGENAAVEFEKAGKLPVGQGEIYRRNARNLGELGIGLNPNAKVTGDMLEDEKAFRTCHFAIGSNYDEDAPAMIHLDGVVRDPTITVTYAGGGEYVIEKNGVLQEL